MKYLGDSKDNGKIVELTGEEFRAIGRIIRVFGEPSGNPLNPAISINLWYNI